MDSGPAKGYMEALEHRLKITEDALLKLLAVADDSQIESAFDKGDEAVITPERLINAGRSIDFLPHGIYPSKMIGNEFLKLVDLSGLTAGNQSIKQMLVFH